MWNASILFLCSISTPLSLLRPLFFSLSLFLSRISLPPPLWISPLSPPFLSLITAPINPYSSFSRNFHDISSLFLFTTPHHSSPFTSFPSSTAYSLHRPLTLFFGSSIHSSLLSCITLPSLPLHWKSFRHTAAEASHSLSEVLCDLLQPNKHIGRRLFWPSSFAGEGRELKEEEE